ncbi:uncharacterized protein LOC130753867 [Actinidia eriantha]|uniref:uncharacterized protein LOC130753867 n=1 Tax=Actinidia eriantha TaxID=165200 RepID=UPI00258C599F|nr:uncharacterized protein LOC130753867 [Actinidia eriantha]
MGVLALSFANFKSKSTRGVCVSLSLSPISRSENMGDFDFLQLSPSPSLSLQEPSYVLGVGGVVVARRDGEEMVVNVGNLELSLKCPWMHSIPSQGTLRDHSNSAPQVGHSPSLSPNEVESLSLVTAKSPPVQKDGF